MIEQEEQIRHLFGMNIESKMAFAEHLSPLIAQIGERLVACLLRDNKILLCGFGRSAANCLHFSAAMLNRFEIERPPLPVIALSPELAVAITTESHADALFARQIQVLGQQGDILLAVSASGGTQHMLETIATAQSRGMDVVVLSNREADGLSSHLGPEDVELGVPGVPSAIVHEMHLFILHCFCDLIEKALFGQMIQDRHED